MNSVARRIFKIVLPLGLLIAVLAVVIFGNYALSISSPEWLRFIAREIQAACRDVGTQWMVVACLGCYFITFLVLGRHRIRPHSTLNPQPSISSSSRHLSRVTRHVFSNPDVWLTAFVGLVLLRYAFDYTNAAKSLQVVVLLTGIVIGKGIALWSGWGKPRTLKLPDLPLSRPAATLSPSDGERAGVSGSSALNSPPSTLNRVQSVLCVLIFLLAGASLWHPARGMEFFYRGVKRWTGPWDNPNLFGLLMGVGVVLAVGMIGDWVWRIGIWGGEKRRRPPLNTQPSTLNFCRRFPSLVTRHLPLVLLVLSAALCGYGLIKSLSRGAWLGTAVGLGFLLWHWLNREPREIREKLTREKPATFNLQPATRRLWLPLSVLLASLFVICFWQFRHTESPLLRRVFSVGNVNDFSWRNRVAAWAGAGRMMMDKPLHGFGWGQAEQVYSKEYRAARLEESAAIQMNDYLMIGISAGVPALLCLVLYLGQAISRRSSVEGRTLDELATFNPQLATIASSGAFVLLIGFWFDGGMFKLPTAVVFWLLLELAQISSRPVRRGEGQGEGLDLLGEAPGLPLNSQPSTLNSFTLALRWSAGIASVLAVALTAIHLFTPQLAVSERTLAVARKFLVPPQEQTDFAYLAAKPIWAGVPLKTLLQHAHLAHYNRTLVNWKLEDELYREFVLSPEINLQPATFNIQPATDSGWRRELWEYFYPRIRRESTLGAAAEIVLREVREKVATQATTAPETILESWRRGQATALGRARLEVAASRSVGIPARLSQSDRAEFWNGTAWVE